MTHSKCRSRSSYCRRTSFSRSRTLQPQLSVPDHLKPEVTYTPSNISSNDRRALLEQSQLVKRAKEQKHTLVDHLSNSSPVADGEVLTDRPGILYFLSASDMIHVITYPLI